MQSSAGCICISEENALTQCVIGTTGLKDLSLLVQREVLVLVLRVDVLLVQVEDFVV